MRIIEKLHFCKLYNGYAQHVPTDEYATRKVAYMCSRCRTSFTVSHKWHGYSHGEYCDRFLHCPKCGNVFDNHGRNMGFREAEHRPGSNMPEVITLLLYELEHGYRLTVVTKCVSIRQTGEVERFQDTEIIKFDVKEKKVTWRNGRDCGPMELGSPYNRLFLEGTVLGDISLNVTRTQENRTALTGFLRKLRDGVRRKFKEIHGYDIGSLFTRRGTSFGFLTMPIMGIAYRLIMPDIRKGLPDFIYEAGFFYNDAIKRLGLACENYEDQNKLFRNSFTIRNARDSVTGIMEVYGIRNIPSYRSIIMDYPLHAGYVSVLDKYFVSDTACSLFRRMTEVFGSPKGYLVPDTVNRLDKLLKTLTGIWSADETARFVMKHIGTSELWDTQRMIGMLTAKNKNLLRQVRLKDAHDWMHDALYRQEHSDYSLEISDAVRRRLEMQKDRLKFFMPDTSFKLRDVGRVMHNCVGSYAKRVLDNKCGIVVMTDDKGTMLACLEITTTQGRNRLVQAKLKGNRPIRLNAAVNDAVAEWCRSAGVGMITADIELPEERRKRLEEQKKIPLCPAEGVAV